MSRVNRIKLRQLVADVGPSARAVSLAAGLGSTAVKDILSGKSKDPGAATLTSIAKVLNVSVSELLEGDDGGPTGLTHVKLEPRRLPVRYTVQAGLWHGLDADEPPEEKWLSVFADPRYEQFPQWLEKVIGDSVDQRIRPGQYVIVVDWAELGVEPKTGQWVVVERRRDHGAIRERTIKQVEVTDTGRILLWPRSNNPKWQSPVDYKAGAKPGEDVELAIMGLVIGAHDADF